MGCVYLVTNKVNGKQYVGKTVHTMNVRKIDHERYARGKSGCVFHRALKKYGFDTFEWEEVYFDEQETRLNQLEVECIAWYGTKVPEGYNLTDGGEGASNPPLSVRLKRSMMCSKALKGKSLSLEHRKSLSRSRKGKTFGPHTALHNANISRGLMGKKKSPEHVAKMKKALTGRKFSPEQRIRWSVIHTNRQWSVEELEKRRVAAAKRARINGRFV